MSTDKGEEFLKHYGIMGMKWGVRRFQPYPKGEGHKGKFKPKTGIKAATRRTKAKASKQLRINRAEIKGKKAKKARLRMDTEKLTNDQLRALNERIQLEQTYHNLQKGSVSEGQKFVKNLLTTSFSIAATPMIVEQIKEVIENVKKGVEKI